MQYTLRNYAPLCNFNVTGLLSFVVIPIVMRSPTFTERGILSGRDKTLPFPGLSPALLDLLKSRVHVFGSHPQRAAPFATPSNKVAAPSRQLLLPSANLLLRPVVHQGDALPVLVPPRAVPQKSCCATSQPWRTSDTSPFALPRKAKPPKRTHASHSKPKKGTNPYE
jgi:hypothetical protein